MKRDIKAPAVGESITEVRIGRWTKQTGQGVKTGEVLLEIESDKATVEVVAEVSGALTILRKPGETVKIGEVIGQIEEGAAGTVKATETAKQAPAPGAPTASAGSGARAQPAHGEHTLSPAVRKAIADSGVDATAIHGTGPQGRITKGDVLGYVAGAATAGDLTTSGLAPVAARPGERREPMSLLRQRIAERLVEAQNTAAILTTFNECDMTKVMELRNRHKDSFKTKHGVSLGFMSFFTKAVIGGLKEVPALNAFVDGTEFVFHDYYDIGVAVGTERGLVVPVLRDVGRMTFADIEKGIAALAVKARDGKLSIPELTGGTFSISNGGVYGSLMSTPILNPPQSGILGMHKIQERPVAVNGQVVIRPMMYLALSYDHRIVDGKEAVTFLVKVKEGIENPETLGFSE